MAPIQKKSTPATRDLPCLIFHTRPPGAEEEAVAVVVLAAVVVLQADHRSLCSRSLCSSLFIQEVILVWLKCSAIKNWEGRDGTVADPEEVRPQRTSFHP
jgi:hypothetical protein